jgi:hypothetical protein
MSSGPRVTAPNQKKGNTIMNTTHNTKTKRLIAVLGSAAAAAVAPALLFAGAGTAHADCNFFTGECTSDPNMEIPIEQEPMYTPPPNPYASKFHPGASAPGK